MVDLLNRYKEITKRVAALNDEHAPTKYTETYREILKLHDMLETAKIPHRFHPHFDGYQILYPLVAAAPDSVCSVVEFFGSYGMEDDKLEIMGLLTEEEEDDSCVQGWLTAENVFSRIEAHWKAHKEEA